MTLWGKTTYYARGRKGMDLYVNATSQYERECIEEAYGVTPLYAKGQLSCFVLDEEEPARNAKARPMAPPKIIEKRTPEAVQAEHEYLTRSLVDMVDPYGLTPQSFYDGLRAEIAGWNATRCRTHHEYHNRGMTNE